MLNKKEKLVSFLNNRWLVFVAAMWMQSFAGVGYLFGSLSPTIKSALNYNQKQIASLAIAKDLGGSIGFLAGYLIEVLPLWAGLLVGVLQNFVGYGLIWLIVTGRAPVLPLWVMCIVIFVGSNGETYFNTVALVSCVQNFSKNRGLVLGTLKGFAGLSGAILTQIYALIHAPDQASLIFMVAVGPSMVVIALLFIVRPVGGHRQDRPADGFFSSAIYSLCLVLAAYLMGVMLVEDLVDVSQNIIVIFTLILFLLLVIPIMIPIWLTFTSDPSDPEQDSLLPEPRKQEAGQSAHDDAHEIIYSEVEAETSGEVDLPRALERREIIDQLQAQLAQAAVIGTIGIKRRGPHIGEDFTLAEALVKADFWLICFSLLLGSGSGLTVIDNLGQMSQSLGYDNTHVFVSMICIWNFLGRVGGGYFSEKVVRDYAYPRPVAMAVAQVLMATGHFFFAMGWPGAMYIGTLLVGLGYGAHWSIVPAATSELFGLKKFGAFYNFLTMTNPAGSLVFSGLIASSIYDNEAGKQAQLHRHYPGIFVSSFSKVVNLDEPLKCEGAICFFLISLIMSGFCLIAASLSMILVYRTKVVYAQLYGKPRT